MCIRDSSLHLVNVATVRPDAAAAVLHVGGDTLAPVATLQPQAGQVSLSTSLAAGACRLAAVGSSSTSAPGSEDVARASSDAARASSVSTGLYATESGQSTSSARGPSVA